MRLQNLHSFVTDVPSLWKVGKIVGNHHHKRFKNLALLCVGQLTEHRSEARRDLVEDLIRLLKLQHRFDHWENSRLKRRQDQRDATWLDVLKDDFVEQLELLRIVKKRQRFNDPDMQRHVEGRRPLPSDEPPEGRHDHLLVLIVHLEQQLHRGHDELVGYDSQRETSERRNFLLLNDEFESLVDDDHDYFFEPLLATQVAEKLKDRNAVLAHFFDVLALPQHGNLGNSFQKLVTSCGDCVPIGAVCAQQRVHQLNQVEDVAQVRCVNCRVLNVLRQVLVNRHRESF